MLELLLNNTLLLSIVAFILILIPAVIIHELGHFFAAKWAGINVLEFGFGFPPRMLRLFTWGETEFTLNWLPIGGFVRPFGEDMIAPIAEDDYDDEELDAHGKPKKSVYRTEREELLARGVPEHKLMTVNQAKALPRIIFMAAGAGANVISALIVFIISALLGVPQEVGARVQIANIPTGSIFDRSEVALGDAVERVNGELFNSSTTFFTSLQSLAGTDVTLSMRRLADDTAYEITVTPQVNEWRGLVLITTLVEESPGAEAGLLPGDLITAVNGIVLSSTDPIGDVQRASEEFAGRSMTLSIVRNGDVLDILLNPRENPPQGQGRIGIGIFPQFGTNDGVVYQNTNPQVEFVPQPINVAVPYAFNRLWDVLKLIASVPSRIIDGTISPEQARPVSVIGISQIGGEFLKRSILDGTPSLILDFFALISIFLGITNLLPIPALDGGRIVFVLIEILRGGKKIPLQIEATIHMVGFGLLLILGVLLIIFDIFNPLTLVQ